ncbi:MAG: CotH kinase family protein [Prevotella sp.]|jgi:hypothetical protein|nr:CotH kinase family protein [Prevotella sp.]
MKPYLIFLIFILSCSLSRASFQPVGSEQYMIGCYNTGTGGIAVASSGAYPLVYDASATLASTEAFWIITEETANKYSLKNAQTNQYIKYNPDKSDEKYIEMVDALSGNATLFSFLPYTKNGVEYYAIASVADENQFFDKRSYDAVGTYRSQYSDNQLFYFVAKSGIGAQPAGDNLYSFLDSLTLNGNSPASCTRTKSLYFSLPLSQMEGSNVELTVGYKAKHTDYTLRIDDEDVADAAAYTFTNVSAARTFKLEVVQNGIALARTQLIFTGLPIVQLYTTQTPTTAFSRGSIRVHEPEKESVYGLLNAEMRYRGASSLGYQKKSFAVKVKDADWQNKDTSFFNLRSDKYWILDAMALDRSRMRNRVSTDLWNDFSAAPYFKDNEKKMINGTRGKYVEVFIDDQYWGLYCMTERIDRKQLKLKKWDEPSRTIKGVLYKTSGWSYSVMMGYVPDNGPDPSRSVAGYNNLSLTWDAHESVYPDLEDGAPFDWKPLYDIVSFVAKSNDTSFANGVAGRVDLPVWTDYYLLMEMILATDNHGKNAYLYMYDITQEQKLGICVWDMDGVFGIRWDKSRVAAAQDYTEFIIRYEHGEHNLFRRLKAGNVADFNTLLKKRYDKLRFTAFSPDSLQKRFEIYKNQFDVSGASGREKARWNNTDGVSINFDDELNYLKTWISTRCNYLNEKYGAPSSLEEPLSIRTLYPKVVNKILYLDGLKSGQPVRIYNASAACIYSAQSSGGTMNIDLSSRPSGVYCVKVGQDSQVIMLK